MERNRRRVGTTNGVIEGSIWDKRIKVDEGQGGMKMVVHGESNSESKGVTRFKRNHSSVISEKRKSVGGVERSPIPIRKTKSENGRSPNKIPIELKKSRSDSQAFKTSKEKDNSTNVDEIIKCEKERVVVVEDDGADGDEEDVGEEEEVVELELEQDIEEEDKKFDVKEIDIQKEKPKKIVDEDKVVDELLEEDEIPIPLSSIVIKTPPPPQVTNSPKKLVHPPKKLVQEPIKPSPIPTPIPSPSPIADEYFERYPETQSKLQNIVDLVMWRDVSKSAFVFGLGSFVLLSSSFTQDLNFSLISAVSYMALLYLAAIFLYKSILRRGAAVDYEEPNVNDICLIGEEEAIWFLEVILPYLNEFLLKLRSLFSGDPATTMKLAALLFVLARFGSSITIWKMTKLGFFGVFTVPKICNSYSTQLNSYGKFWIRRLRDAWETCSHKKGVAAAVFTVVWNLSSITARIWAAFMLIVGIRYYQQCMLREQWEEEEEIAMKEKKGS